VPITVLEECPEYRLGHVGSVYVSVWFSELSTAALDALSKHHHALAKKYGKITLVSIVVGATKAPGPELRDRLRAETAELAKSRRANIVVVLTKGLSAIITRSFLAMLSLLSSETMKVPATLEEAAEQARKLEGQDEETRNNTTLGADLVAFAALPRPT
jgi:hypothetical protein